MSTNPVGDRSCDRLTAALRGVMPSQLRLDRDQRNRVRWRRRLGAWGTAILLLGALAVVTVEMLT
jgi:hypothetical protein